MVEQTKKVVNNTKELMNLVIERTMTVDALAHMSGTDLEMLQKTKALVDDTMKLMIMQTETINTIDTKLDKLIAELARKG